MGAGSVFHLRRVPFVDHIVQFFRPLLQVVNGLLGIIAVVGVEFGALLKQSSEWYVAQLRQQRELRGDPRSFGR